MCLLRNPLKEPPDRRFGRASDEIGTQTRWSSYGTTLTVHDEEGIQMYSSAATLEGQGDYEGLTAYLVFDWNQQPITFEGTILPGGL